MTVQIQRVGQDEPVRYATAQLKHYLERAGVPARLRASRADGGNGGVICVGSFADLGVSPAAKGEDDAVEIRVSGGQGVIAGANPRSVLLAVYRYLTELGFRWVRPGRDGEVVPRLRVPLTRRVSVQERASYGHRCVCIEGASGWQHVRDMIDWMPKLGFNGYFVQFHHGFTFFERWYRHQLNPRLKKQPFTSGDARDCTERVWAACRKRGLMIQMVGHGWTCDPFGVRGLGWHPHRGGVPGTIRPHLALVKGKRAFWGGVPLNTNLCYGSARTRRIMARAVADYAADHPQVDTVHLWLADGSNNHCECERCRRHRPADLYVRLLNEVDGLLTARGLDTRIVFLIYVDLLWPPRVARITNPDRFILMFAPITRTYSRPFTSSARRAKLPRFVRNRLEMPRSVEQNVSFLRGWQQRFDGDSFDFDYHLMWDHYRDPGHFELAGVLHADIRALRRLGLNGLNSCQVQRCFLPSGLLMTVMGLTLWNRDLDFNRIANDHYRSAFGPDWRKAKRYVQRLSDCFDPPFLRGERKESQLQQTVTRLEKVPGVIHRFVPVMEANVSLPDRCRARSWSYLKHHASLCLALAPMLELSARGERDAARDAARHLIDTARRLESRIHPVFDVFVFLRTVCGGLGFTEQEVGLA